MDGGSPEHRAKALYGDGMLAYGRHDLDRAEERAVENLALRRRVGGPRELITALNFRSLIALYRGDHRVARECLEESIPISVELGDAVPIGASKRALGGVLLYTGDLEGASRVFGESLDAYRAVSNALAVAVVSANLAEARRLLSEHAEARALLEESSRLAREADSTSVEAYVSLILGRTLSDVGDLAGAVETFRRAVELNSKIDNDGGLVEALENGARLLVAAGEGSLARRAMGAATRRRRESGSPLQPVYVAEHARLGLADPGAGDLSVRDAIALVENWAVRRW
jgi:tetratricopeptide (TPR) repeat protein